MIGSHTSSATDLPQAVYTDLSSLNALKARADGGLEEDGQLEEAARQFSSIFLHMALKSMRDASFGGGILDSQQSEFYRDMFDQQLALDLSSSEGFGLTRLIVDQLAPNTDLTTSDNSAAMRSSAEKAATYSRVSQGQQTAGAQEKAGAAATDTEREEGVALP